MLSEQPDLLVAVFLNVSELTLQTPSLLLNKAVQAVDFCPAELSELSAYCFERILGTVNHNV